MMGTDGLVVQQMDVPPGGGAFTLPRLALGLFNVSQQTHRISIVSDRLRHRPLIAGEGWVLPAGTSGICEYDEPHSYIYAEFAPELLEDVDIDASRAFEPLVGTLDPLLVHLIRNAAERTDRPALYRETMDLALTSHLGAVLWQNRMPAKDRAGRRLRRAVDYIEAHLDCDFSLTTLAREATMSRYHFARAFKAAFGQPPHQYVIRRRMEQAKLLLRTTSLPVSEVAYRVGYGDVSRFSVHFKRHAGATPGAFRRG